MEAREKELDKNFNLFKDIPEWLIFKFHSLSSNHSQNWILSLLWIINITTIYSIPESITDIDGYPIGLLSIFIFMQLLTFKLPIWSKKITLIIFPLIFSFKSSITLTMFIKLTSSDITFFGFIFKVVIAYLIYQFVISIRQNMRRK